MKKRFLTTGILLLFYVLLTGMGATPPGEVPQTDINYRVTVTDNQGVSTKCESVSWEGRTFFAALRGNGSISIPFEKIDRVDFLGVVNGKMVNARISLKIGEVVAVTFNREARFFGKASFGSLIIRAKHLRSIDFE